MNPVCARLKFCERCRRNDLFFLGVFCWNCMSRSKCLSQFGCLCNYDIERRDVPLFAIILFSFTPCLSKPLCFDNKLDPYCCFLACELPKTLTNRRRSQSHAPLVKICSNFYWWFVKVLPHFQECRPSSLCQNGPKRPIILWNICVCVCGMWNPM